MLDADNCEEGGDSVSGPPCSAWALVKSQVPRGAQLTSGEGKGHPFVATPRSPGKELRSHKVAQ